MTSGMSWREFADIFTLPFPIASWLSVRSAVVFKNLEVRLLISRKQGPGQPEKQSRSRTQKRTVLASVVSATACVRVKRDLIQY